MNAFTFLKYILPYLFWLNKCAASILESVRKSNENTAKILKNNPTDFRPPKTGRFLYIFNNRLTEYDGFFCKRIILTRATLVIYNRGTGDG